MNTKAEQGPDAAAVADADPGNWVDRIAPGFTLPYLRLARADRPIGTWLLLIPCWWSAALAAVHDGAAYPEPRHLALFAVGAFLMRGAGCTYNDFVDRDFDARVARTRSRPLPSGQVTPIGAVLFLIGLCLAGLLVLVQFDGFVIRLGVASLAIVAVYPFMKRITFWPQVFLGLAFSWGALMGWAAHFGGLGPAPLILYAGTISWIIGYDTIYAHQDKDDDALIGLKSTALKFGPATARWLTLFYALAWALIVTAGYLADAGILFAVAMALAGGHMIWQVVTLDTEDPDNCLDRFRSNRDLGLIVFAGLVGDAAIGRLI